jgi:hypothetical protein
VKTFIKIVEVWTPTVDRKWLALADGIFGKHGAFRAQSEMRSFAYDKGLPGKAWSQARPIIISDIEHSYFQRKHEATQHGLTSAIAIPIFSGEYLLAVIVLLCGDDQHQAGAIELWGKNQEEKLALIEGYFPSLDNFAWQSRRITFSKELGLPGRVWENRTPEIIADITNPTRFYRADLAADIGITTAVGIPMIYDNAREYVLTLLSVKETPFAHRFEIWSLDREQQTLHFQSGYCDQGENLTELHTDTTIEHGDGFLGMVWLTGCPAISHNPRQDGLVPKKSSTEFSSALAMPIIESGHLKSIIVFLF